MLTFNTYDTSSSVKISNALGKDFRLFRPLLSDLIERIFRRSIDGHRILSVDG